MKREFGISTRLIESVQRGGALSVWLVTASTKMALHMSAEPVDALVFDLQHGAIDVPAARDGIVQALLNEVPVICRVPVGDTSMAARLLDAGAGGIVAPMIDSAEDAKRFVRALKYPPLGSRSFGLIEALAHSGLQPVEHLRAANAKSLLLAMIENREALGDIEAIAAVEGIDGLFAGPGDLSIAQTAHAPDGPFLTYPALDADLATIAEAARTHGKQAWTVASSAERARELFALGFQMVVLGSELLHVRRSLAGMLQAARN